MIVAFIGMEVLWAWAHYITKGPFSRESLFKRVITVENDQILVRQGKKSATIPIQGALWREVKSVPEELIDLGFPDVACIVVTDPSKHLWSWCAIILCGFDDARRTAWRQLLIDGGAKEVGEMIVAGDPINAKD